MVREGERDKDKVAITEGELEMENGGGDSVDSKCETLEISERSVTIFV